MKKVLITGATGNVGIQVIRSLKRLEQDLDIFAGVRDTKSDGEKLSKYGVSIVKFDYTEPETFVNAFEKVDILFLLRPPQISNVAKYFRPLIEMATAFQIGHIIFLSVQGVEKDSLIPHHKIERLIVESRIPFTFLRPAYFMQNFATALKTDIRDKKLIFLPAGSAKFTLVDVRDIGLVAAVIIEKIETHINKRYDLTSQERFTFKEIANKMSSTLKIEILYKSPSLLKFYIKKRKEKLSSSLILVMIMLHYFPRFQKPPEISDCIGKLTGKKPISFEQFIVDYRNILAV